MGELTMKNLKLIVIAIASLVSGAASAATPVTSSIGGSVSVIGKSAPTPLSGSCEVVKVPSFNFGQLKGTEKDKHFTLDSVLGVKCDTKGLPITIKFEDKYVTAGDKSSSGDMAYQSDLYTFNADIKTKVGDMKLWTNDKVHETSPDFRTGESSIGGKNIFGIKYVTFTSTGGEQDIHINGDLVVNFQKVNSADPVYGKIYFGEFKFKMPFTVYAQPLNKI